MEKRRAPLVFGREASGWPQLEGDLLVREKIDGQIDGGFRSRSAGGEHPVAPPHQLRHIGGASRQRRVGHLLYLGSAGLALHTPRLLQACGL